jgi:demethylmenaquinone methyltransferase/2-methoxy-6-polyprenyl-1,4-benzoquinol methylase
MDEPISRVQRSKQDAKANYDRLSRWYDVIAGSSEAKYRQIGIEVLDLLPGERIIEIGFGTGTCLVDFARRTDKEGMVCGIDLSVGMAMVAQDRLIKKKLLNLVDLTIADGARIPFSGHRFDAVFMSFTLELFDTPELPFVLQECKRVLNPEGRLVVVSLEKHSPPTIAEKIYEVFHQLMPVLVDCRPINAQEVIIDAGFVIDSVIQEKMWGLPVIIIAGSCV